MERVVYAADRDNAARGGFDDREFYDLFTRPRDSWPVVVEGAGSRSEPFDLWLATQDRVAY